MLPFLAIAASAAELSAEWLDVTRPLPEEVSFFAQTLTSMAHGPTDTTAFGATRYGVFLLPQALVIHEQGPRTDAVAGTKQPTSVRQVVLPRNDIEALPLLDGCLVVVRKNTTSEKACLDAVKRFPTEVELAITGWMATPLSKPVTE